MSKLMLKCHAGSKAPFISFGYTFLIPKWFQGVPVGLVAKVSTSRAEDRGFESHLRQDFFRVESYQ